MKVLVAVASKHGSTREIASAIAKELWNSAIEADLRDIDDVRSLEGYDAVVFGSAIYAGSWLNEAKSFVEHFRAPLSELPVWVFSSGPLGVEDPQPHEDLLKLAAPLGGIEVRDHHIFVGKLDPAELGFGERMVAKVVKAPYGDFRDWDDIRAWARTIAVELQPASAQVQK